MQDKIGFHEFFVSDIHLKNLSKKPIKVIPGSFTLESSGGEIATSRRYRIFGGEAMGTGMKAYDRMLAPKTRHT